MDMLTRNAPSEVLANESNLVRIASDAGNAVDLAERPLDIPLPPKDTGDTSWNGLLPITALLIAIAFWVGRTGWYTAGDNVGYTLGLVGGVMMLLLLLYPLRKYFQFFRNWGAVKYWFGAHMVLGIAGPALVLAHSTFHLHSTNASVAMICMLIVAGSGIVGRFLYTKVHRGLYGEKLNLQELKARTGMENVELPSRLHFAPGVEACLKAFEMYAMPAYRSVLHDGWRFVTIGLRRGIAYRRCIKELRPGFAAYAKSHDWDGAAGRSQYRKSKALIREFLASAQRISQFSTYDRLLQLWHVAHVPLVYLLLLSGITHVVAVHMY